MTYRFYTITIVTFLLALFSGVDCFAEEDYARGLVFYYDPDSHEASCGGFYWTVDGMTDRENVEVPASVTLHYTEWNETLGKPVTGCKSYRVTSVALDAFANSKRLKHISLPAGLKIIYENAFGHCDSLETVIIGDGPVSISDGTFYSCPELKSVILPNTLKSIGTNAFYGCEKLTRINFPHSLEEIGSMAFSNCSSLCDVTLPDRLRKIGYAAFGGCAISSITIPASVQETDEYSSGNVFLDCDSLVEMTVHGPESFSDRFFGCDNVLDLTLGDEIKQIESLSLPFGKNMNSLTIGRGVKTISEEILPYGEINEIRCLAENPPVFDSGYWGGDSRFSTGTYRNATLTVPERSIGRYASAKGWKQFFERDGRLVIKGHIGYFADLDNISVDGVTADGMSQLLIYPEFEDLDFKVASYSLTVLANGRDVTDNTELTGHFSQYQMLDNGKWGFVYTAPEDFIPKSGSRYSITVQLEMTDAGGKVAKMHKDICVARCGVVLLHGLFSDAGCFKDVREYLLANGHYENWQINNVSYKSYNTASFDSNTDNQRIVQSSLKTMFNMLLDHGIVSSRYDLVGHSMGGILARKYAQEVYSDAVNRIITVNTPHSGSELAALKDYLLEKLTQLIASGVKTGWAVAALLNQFGVYEKILPAINNLECSSEAIAKLNDELYMRNANGIPVHAISSYMTPYSGSEASESDFISYGLSLAADRLEPVGGLFSIASYIVDSQVEEIGASFMYHIWDRLYRGDNDGVVSVASQTGGLSGKAISQFHSPFVPVLGWGSSTSHTNICHWDEAISRLDELLISPKNSDCFADRFSPVVLKNWQLYPFFEIGRYSGQESVPEPSDSTRIGLKLEKDDAFRVLNVGLESSGDVTKLVAFACLDDNTTLMCLDTAACSFSIPETFGGSLAVYAIGLTADGAVVSDSAVVEYERTASADYLYFENGSSILMCVGDEFTPTTVCGWTNGSEEYVTPSFHSDSPELLDMGDGVVTAIMEGQCMLYGSYMGKTDSIVVRIIPAMQPAAVREVRADAGAAGVSLQYAGSQLVLCSDGRQTGPVTVTVHDAAGIRHLWESFRSDGTSVTRIDLSSLPAGLYIARARTDRGVVSCKFLRQ